MTFRMNDLMVDVLLTDVQAADPQCGACTKCTKCTEKTGDPSECTNTGIQCEDCGGGQEKKRADAEQELELLRAQLRDALLRERETVVV